MPEELMPSSPLTIATIVISLLGVVLCGRFPDPPVFAAVQHYPSICYLPPDSGLCPTSAADDADEKITDLLVRYYFDVTTEQCYAFGVQLCGGNENRFKSRSACQTYCKLDYGKNDDSK